MTINPGLPSVLLSADLRADPGLLLLPPGHPPHRWALPSTLVPVQDISLGLDQYLAIVAPLHYHHRVTK